MLLGIMSEQNLYSITNNGVNMHMHMQIGWSRHGINWTGQLENTEKNGFVGRSASCLV